jgi:hypothetical protein
MIDFKEKANLLRDHCDTVATIELEGPDRDRHR